MVTNQHRENGHKGFKDRIQISFGYLGIWTVVKKKNKKTRIWISHFGSVVMNPTSIHEDTGSIPGLVQWVKDPELLWLWCRLAAVAPIRPLAWEPPYAAAAALKSKTKKKKKKERKKEMQNSRES